MKVAIDHNKNRIYSDDGINYKGHNILCPGCLQTVIFCNGPIIKPYFRHEAKEYCKADWEPETDWHYEMKNMFHDSEIEQIVRCGENYKKADVLLKNGLVIEMQHSPISYDERRIREMFYKNMIWVFDATEPYINGRITIYKNDTFEWVRPRRALRNGIFLNIDENWFVRLDNIIYEYEYIQNWHSYRTPILKGSISDFDEYQFVKMCRQMDENINIQTTESFSNIDNKKHQITQLTLF